MSIFNFLLLTFNKYNNTNRRLCIVIANPRADQSGLLFHVCCIFSVNLIFLFIKIFYYCIPVYRVRPFLLNFYYIDFILCTDIHLKANAISVIPAQGIMYNIQYVGALFILGVSQVVLWATKTPETPIPFISIGSLFTSPAGVQTVRTSWGHWKLNYE